MTTPDSLSALLVGGDVDACVEFFRGAHETQRRTYAAAASSAYRHADLNPDELPKPESQRRLDVTSVALFWTCTQLSWIAL